MEWKQIPGFNKYEASDDGRIRQIKPRKVLDQFFSFNNPLNYYTVRIANNKGALKLMYVHRLICMAFHGVKEVDENGNRYVVDHIDCNKHNNNADNLRWVTHADNMVLAMKNGLRNDNIEITIEDTLTGESTVYYSIIEVSRALNITRDKVYSCLYLFKDKRLFLGRFRFKYNKEKFGAVVRKKNPCFIYDLLTKKWTRYESHTEAAINTGLQPGLISTHLVRGTISPLCGFIIGRNKNINIPNYTLSEIMNMRKNIYKIETNPIPVYIALNKLTRDMFASYSLKEICEYLGIAYRNRITLAGISANLRVNKPYVSVVRTIV